MTLEERVREATCRVDYEGKQLGSCFWIEKGSLVTAAHVTDIAPEKTVAVRTAEGDLLDAEVVYQDLNTDDDPGSDLALLQASETPDEYGTLSVESTVPPVGTEMVWSGYARLFGESQIERQRFGWGRVASEPYGDNRGTFFEIDGLFNPSHSGGPVVREDTGQVAGVVSATAGGFSVFRKFWEPRAETLSDLFETADQLGKGSRRMGYIYQSKERAIAKAEVFEELGLSVHIGKSHRDGYQVLVDMDEVSIEAAQLQTELSELLLDSAQSTFQMGVGIASGGRILTDTIS